MVDVELGAVLADLRHDLKDDLKGISSKLDKVTEKLEDHTAEIAVLKSKQKGVTKMFVFMITAVFSVVGFLAKNLF